MAFAKYEIDKILFLKGKENDKDRQNYGNPGGLGFLRGCLGD
jgi:hypothetical protein